MEQNFNNNDNGLNRLFSQLAAEKKKTVVVICLLAMMIFMWLRMFSSKTPESAKASSAPAATGQAQSDSESSIKISFVELPVIEGRNDVLTRDFFVVDNIDIEVNAKGKFNSGNIGKEPILRVVKKIQLKAIELGQIPRVFINDKLLTLGEKFVVKEGEDSYEFEVMDISENIVFCECEGVEVILKLEEPIDITTQW